jgi:hypothetical protein
MNLTGNHKDKPTWNTKTTCCYFTQVQLPEREKHSPPPVSSSRCRFTRVWEAPASMPPGGDVPPPRRNNPTLRGGCVS